MFRLKKKQQQKKKPTVVNLEAAVLENINILFCFWSCCLKNRTIIHTGDCWEVGYFVTPLGMLRNRCEQLFRLPLKKDLK